MFNTVIADVVNITTAAVAAAAVINTSCCSFNIKRLFQWKYLLLHQPIVVTVKILR